MTEEEETHRLPGWLRMTLLIIGWTLAGIAALVVVVGGICVAIIVTGRL